MKLYSSFDKKGRVVVGSWQSGEDCISKTVQRINELGFAKSIYKKGQEKSVMIFEVEEYEEIFTDNGIDYTDDKIILEVEITAKIIKED